MICYYTLAQITVVLFFFRQEARQRDDRDGFSREAGRFLRLVLSHGGTFPVELLSDFFEAENPLSLESDYFPPGA